MVPLDGHAPAPGGAQGQPWHALPAEEAVAALASDAAAGLTPAAALEVLGRTGPNTLPEPPRPSVLAVFLGQFKSPLIYLLLLVGGVAIALGHVSDGVVIYAVVLLNAVVGSVQEGRAERSLQALRRLAAHTVRVVRGGREAVLEARELVPGDVVLLEPGDVVAADARLLHGAALRVAEAALTGESAPVSKGPAATPPDTPLADRLGMVYAGTHVAAGRGRALVVATGLRTEIGRIAALAEAAAQPRTPLERRIAQFGRHLMVVAAVLLVAIVAIGALRGVPLGDVLMVGVSQVVGMIPEGLPVAMTVALSVGVLRMARRKAVVRRLAAVETLGSTTVICTDKTGTLTRNEMTVTAAHLPDGRELAVTGVGYQPRGEFLHGGRALDPARDEPLRALLEAAVLCNDAQLQHPEAADPRWIPLGDPTEVALLALALKGGVDPGAQRTRWPRSAELPFDPAAKMMATQHGPPGRSRLIVKGAPEEVLRLCGAARRAGQDEPMEPAARAALREVAEGMARRALRVLAVAVAEGAELDARGFAGLEGRLSLLGLLGQLDPPRAEAKGAVERCRRAGITPVMVTGDHQATGHAIATALGIAREDQAPVSGRELEGMSDAELARRIGDVAVFARVHPAQKLRIVEAYQRRGEVVAMTGDGVNDAPALARADVGVAMGLTGTEVAKEAAKIVIADDDFATILAAVEEGRVVYRNLKKAILLLFSTAAAEVAVLLLAMLLGYPPPFSAVQILWNNLVTEGLITVNLVMDPPEGDEMQRPPIPPGEPLLTRTLLARMAFMTPAIVVATLGWFLARTAAGVPAAEVRTEAFTLLAVCEWFNVLNCRSETRSALTLGVLQNRWLVAGLLTGNLLQVTVVFYAPLGRFFHTVPLSPLAALAIPAVGSLVLWVEELRKLVARRRVPASP